MLNASGLERTASRHRNEAFWPVKCYSAVMEGMVSVIGGGKATSLEMDTENERHLGHEHA